MIVRPDGWLEGVCRVSSPNYDARPPGSAIGLIVIHNISLPPGQYGGDHISRLFTNTLEVLVDPYFAEVAGLQVSAHVLIERDGAVTQFVSFANRAWHAGVSYFNGRAACNDFSVGIELEGTDFEAFADVQYATLNSVIAALLATYPIEAVRGHADIAPDRKTDPGPFFDWRRVDLPSGVSTPPA
ncbi:MAG: 1,6-anhydro-N-acetylmuramyl-L-alanine amidase AmpD [Burkholderiaceae bacterium]